MREWDEIGLGYAFIPLSAPFSSFLFLISIVWRSRRGKRMQCQVYSSKILCFCNWHEGLSSTEVSSLEREDVQLGSALLWWFDNLCFYWRLRTNDEGGDTQVREYWRFQLSVSAHWKFVERGEVYVVTEVGAWGQSRSLFSRPRPAVRSIYDWHSKVFVITSGGGLPDLLWKGVDSL